MADHQQSFRIAFVPGVTVSKWVRVWSERRPDVPLVLIQTDQAVQDGVLRAGEADMAFVRLPVHGDGLNVIPLYREKAFVVVPRDHPIALFDEVTVADLVDEELVTDVAEDAIALVAAGAGVTVMPQSIVRLHGRKDVVARPVTDAPETTVGLAWLGVESDVVDDRIDEFIGIVRGRTARSSRGTAAPDEKPDVGGPPPRTAAKEAATGRRAVGRAVARGKSAGNARSRRKGR